MEEGLNNLLAQNRQFIELLGPAYAAAASSTVAAVSNRVFVKGEATEGGKIGSYNSDPTYVGRSSFLTKGAANKVLGSKGKRKKQYDAAKASGKPGAIRSKGAKGAAVYFTDGYKGIRDAEGLETGFVNLERSGKMSQAYNTEIVEDGFNLGFSNSKDAAKMRGNEKRFGIRIISLSAEEIELAGLDISDIVFKSFE